MVLLKITKPFQHRVDDALTIAYLPGEIEVDDATAQTCLAAGAGDILEDFGEDDSFEEWGE